MGKEALTLRDISKYYTNGQSVVMGLNRVNLTFRVGEFVAITGESGSGKSTMAKIMAGILPYENGEMLLFDRPTSHYDGSDWERYRSDSISFISQSYDILPGCSVERNVLSALRLTGVEQAEAKVRAEEILREVELWDMRKRRAAKLSSGQMQRLSIARALAKPAPILIADEPTGNLDPENSAKVIRLLSAAAKDRLVVMITHEFDEAADCATRHITLQDGIVASDMSLRPPAETDDAAPVRKRETLRGLSFYTALLQIGSRPVWSSIMLLFFALTAFATFAFLGTFIVNLDDTSTRIYDNSAFRNGDKERIVVVRTDGQSLTEEDINKLCSVPHLESMERYGLAADANYFYREGIDYSLHYYAIGNTATSDATHLDIDVTLENRSLYIETIPLLPEGEEFLTAGRLPETMFEVVAGDESLLGETIPVYVQDIKNWGNSYYLAFEATVVGTTDLGPHLYFSDKIGRSISNQILHNSPFIVPNYTDELDGQFLCSPGVLAQVREYEERNGIQYLYRGMIAEWISHIDDGALAFLSYGNGPDTLLLRAAGTIRYDMLYGIEVSPESYEILVEDQCSTQVCLYIEDYAYTDEVLEEVQRLGYGALSPYQLGSNTINETRAEERMQTLKVCLLALIAVILLQIVVLRAMFSMEMEEYRLLANLGLRCKNARRSVLWQMLLFSLGGEVLASIAIAVCSMQKIQRIASILRYLPVPYMLLIWMIHIAAGLIASAWIVRALRRSVYPVTGEQADLTMEDEEEEEVEA